MFIRISLLALCLGMYLNGFSEEKRIALVTGTSKGIGLCIAKKLAESGYLVYGGMRKTSDMRDFDRVVEESNGNLKAVVVDVTDAGSIEKAVQAILEESGKIDILINNACEVIIGTCETLTMQEHQRVMDVNYFGPLRMIQAVLPSMRAHKSGHIINISSVAGFEGFPLLESYVASKFALEGLSESMAIYLKTWNINVILVEPSGVKTKVAANSPLGSRYNEKTACFHEFCQKSHLLMQKSIENAQPAEEIADLIDSILLEKEPKLRYQTNPISKQMAENRFKDPTGELLLPLKRQRMEPLLRLMGPN